MGVEMTPDVRAWDDDQRRIGSILVLGAAAVLLVAGAITYVFAKDAADVLYWVLVGVLVLLLAFEAALFVLAAMSSRATPAPHHEGEPEPHYGPGAGAPEPRGARSLALRCGECGTEFELTDTGERPLHHVCPGCGLEGVLKDDVAPSAAEAAPSPYAPPAERREPEPAPQPAPAAAPAEPAPVKRLKLRCGGCREVFSIDDSGERPLRRPCPHCGRVGEVR